MIIKRPKWIFYISFLGNLILVQFLFYGTDNIYLLIVLSHIEIVWWIQGLNLSTLYASNCLLKNWTTSWLLFAIYSCIKIKLYLSKKSTILSNGKDSKCLGGSSGSDATDASDAADSANAADEDVAADAVVAACRFKIELLSLGRGLLIDYNIGDIQ